MTVDRVKQVLAAAPYQTSVDTEWVGQFPCEGSRFHNPKPMAVRPVDLAAVLRPPVDPKDKDVVYLCGTCKDNLLVYLAVLDSNRGTAPMGVRRDFGNEIRKLGDRSLGYAGVTS